jgi:DNA-binding transcriptional LysR family regulator
VRPALSALARRDHRGLTDNDWSGSYRGRQGVLLLKRSTHHVSLTAAGAAFLAGARQILAHAVRAAAIARSAADASAALRVGIGRATSMPSSAARPMSRRLGWLVSPEQTVR